MKNPVMGSCAKVANGYQIVVCGQIIRQASAKPYSKAFLWPDGTVRLSRDSQLIRLKGEPIAVELKQE